MSPAPGPDPRSDSAQDRTERTGGRPFGPAAGLYFSRAPSAKFQPAPCQRNAGHPQDVLPFLGTPDQTLTGGLPLRRRSLYTTELQGHMEGRLRPENSIVPNGGRRCQGLWGRKRAEGPRAALPAAKERGGRDGKFIFSRWFPHGEYAMINFIKPRQDAETAGGLKTE